MEIATPVVTAMGCIVKEVERKKLAYLKMQDSHIQCINYMYGHWLEISSRLQSMSQDKDLRYQKFPLILLIEDFPINEGRGDFATTTLNMLICAQTSPNFLSEQRQKETFDPIIIPIYNELIVQICKSGYFVQTSERKIPRKVIDRKYLGREAIYGNNANIAFEWIDARQIQNMELTINKSFCFTEGIF